MKKLKRSLRNMQADLKTTSRKDVVYLIEYFILYSSILFYKRVSREFTLDLL